MEGQRQIPMQIRFPGLSMREEPDYYAILQVSPKAEREVIEGAYRRLAAKYHPDVDPSPDANRRMALLNEAYEVLSNQNRRSEYDRRRGLMGRTGPVAGARMGGADTREWMATLLWTAGILLVSAVVSRYGIRGVVLVGLVVLAAWLGMSARRG